MEQVRVGVIGTSWWADAMYLPSLAGTPEAVVTACCGRNEERAREFARRWDIPGVFTDWEAMLREAPLDAVIVTTPNDTHAPITLAALEAGLHVLCEKPLALNHADAQRMTEAAEAKQAITLVPFTYSFSPMARTLKRLVDEGFLGTPYHLNFRYYAYYGRDPGYSWRFDPRIAGSGALGDIGSHFLYLATWYFGEVTHVTAELANVISRTQTTPDGEPYTPADDFSLILLTFANGAKGVVHATTVAHEPTPWGQTHHLDLHGSGGTLRAWTDWESICEITAARAEDSAFHLVEIPELVQGGKPRTDLQQVYKETFRKQGRMTGDFIRAVRSGSPAQPDFAAGTRVQRILDAALLSAREGRRVAIQEIA
jgi:predicted dehydrogenase